MVTGVVRIKGELEDRDYCDAAIERESDEADLQNIVGESFEKVADARLF
ncbi:MAG: hypothetical protein HY813_03905 [Candidatus Portnoybacteria bacterium]|nr:hypothetical protein [Candidatus Portnoybacteria bacterium]